jgi:sensor domain CHASE-containing protein
MKPDGDPAAALDDIISQLNYSVDIVRVFYELGNGKAEHEDEEGRKFSAIINSEPMIVVAHRVMNSLDQGPQPAGTT